MTRTLTRFFQIALLFVANLAMAAPAALVEDISGQVSGVQLLDFVAPGQVLDLGQGGKLTLGYLASCVREQISGGQVTVGKEQSEVSAGAVQRHKTQCDGGRLALAANQAMHSGAVALRDIDPKAEPSLTLHHVSPLILLPKPGRVVIKRIDQTGERHKIEVAQGPSARPRLDLAEHKIQLAAGGKYMISVGGVALIFQVDKQAGQDQANTLGRVLPF